MINFFLNIEHAGLPHVLDPAGQFLGLTLLNARSSNCSLRSYTKQKFICGEETINLKLKGLKISGYIFKRTDRKIKIFKFKKEHTLVLQSLEENGVVPEACLLLILRVLVSGSVMILDSGGDDIQHQGPPAQAEGGDQEDVQGEEVLGKGQLGPDHTFNKMNNARVSIADG